VAIVAALAGAAGLALAVEGGRWWMIGDVGVGPIGTQRCFGGDCQPGGLRWAGGSDLWERAGVATYTAGLVAALVLVILAGAVAAGRTARLPAVVSVVAIATAAGAGALFVTTRPELPDGEVARGIWLFGGALIAAAVAAAATLWRRPG